MKDEPSAHVAANVKLSQSKKEKVCSTHVGEKLYQKRNYCTQFSRHVSQAEWMWPKLNICPQSHLQVAEPKNQKISSPSKCSFLSCKMDLAKY